MEANPGDLTEEKLLLLLQRHAQSMHSMLRFLRHTQSSLRLLMLKRQSHTQLRSSQLMRHVEFPSHLVLLMLLHLSHSSVESLPTLLLRMLHSHSFTRELTSRHSLTTWVRSQLLLQSLSNSSLEENIKNWSPKGGQFFYALMVLSEIELGKYQGGMSYNMIHN